MITIEKNKGFSMAIIAIIGAVIIFGGAYYFNTKPSGTEMGKQGEMEVNIEGSQVDGQTGSQSMDGSYLAYSPEKLSLASEGQVVLFFRAPWCPTCRALNADIKANLSDIPKGVVILDVDYDSSTALKQKYKVTYQHTLVQVDAEGNQIAKWSNSPTLEELISHLQ